MNYKFPSKEVIERLRKKYPTGTRVELISINERNPSLNHGEKGTVSQIADEGIINVNWDCGSSLGLLYNVDHFALEKELYDTGAEMWCDKVMTHGKDAAAVVCGYNLGKIMQRKLSDIDEQFARELFDAMYEDTAGISNLYKLVYPYDYQKAVSLCEGIYYTNSRIRNNECARAIDSVINKSCYQTNYYNLEIAAMRAITYYGFTRVMMTLAHFLQKQQFDGRFSKANKQWALSIDVPTHAFENALINAHPILIDSFVGHVRDLYDKLVAERFVLPGEAESNTFEDGYEIIRTITFNANRGFAIGRDTCSDQFVCWQFTIVDGKRKFCGGAYGDKKETADNYTARVCVYMENEKTEEV